MSPPDLATRRLLIFVVLLCANNAVASQTNDTSDQVRRSPVPIYKGPEPWRPLSNAVAFGVKRVGVEDEGQERLNAVPNVEAPTPTNAESLDEPSESLQKEQQPPHAEANNRKHFKLALHESLRRPLKRLTDRQLALLLKQIRRQRQRQFSRESKETEQQEKELQEGLSRTDMLAQIKELLPQDGQRLLRPKLLTNVNVLPNEWAIYPPPRRPTHRENDADASPATNATQQKEEGVEIDGNLYHLGGGGDGDEHNGTTTATEQTETAETTVTFSINETLPPEITTITTDAITTSLPIEMRATIRPPIVQTLELNPLSEVPLETTAKSGDVKLDQTEEEPQLTDITSQNLTTENKPVNILSADDNTTTTQAIEVADKTTEAGKVEIVEKTAQTTIVNESVTEQPNLSGKAEIATQPKVAGQPNENITIEEKNMAKLEAGWKVLEQKFAAEMKQAKKKADAAIAKLQKQRKEAEQRGKEGSNSAVLFSSKTLNVPSKSDSDELRGLNITHYVQQERAQIGRLSSALHAIRVRYENVKRHFLNKMRRLGLAHRFQGDTPPAFSSKIAGAPTTLVHGDDQNATEEGHNVDNGANLNGTDQASETLTTSAEIQQNPELRHIDETTIVSILSNAEDITNGTTEPPVNDKSRSKSKPKLTLAELAAELEQIEREIEESVATKKKGVLRGNKKVKQNRARVSSSPSPSNASSSSADSLPISASIGAKLRQKPPNHKSEDNGTTAILEEEEVRQQQNPIGKQIAVQPSQLPPGSNESLRRRILTTQKTSKSVLVDTSTEKSEDEPHHEVAQQHNKIAQKHRSEGHMGKTQQHRERTKLNQEVSIAATRGGLTEQQATGFPRQPLQQTQQLNGQFDQNAQSQHRQFEHNAQQQQQLQHPQHVAQQQTFPQHGPQPQNFQTTQQAQQFGAQQQHVQPQQTPQQQQPPNHQQQNFQAQRQQQSTQTVQQQSLFPQQQNDVHPQLHQQHQQSFITQQPQFQQQSFQPIQQQPTQTPQFQQQSQFQQQQLRTQHPQQLQQQQHPPVSQLSQPFQPQQPQQHFQQVPQQQQSLQSPQLISSQHHQQVTQQLQQRGQLGRANVYNPHSTTAHTTTRGFYQLEHAQVTNVSPKSPLLPPTNLPKLKGVSQVEVAQSVDATPELSTMELSNELRKEMRNQQKQKHKGNNHAKQNAKNEAATPKPKLEDEDLENLEEFARIDEQAICDAIACNFETGSLCDWETSIDELKPNDPRFHRYMLARTYLRHKRQQENDGATNGTVPSKQDIVDTTNVTIPRQEHDVDMKNSTVTSPDKTKQEGGGRVVVRSWHNWVGRYRNRLTGISRAEVFSTRNQRFAATYVKPGQHSMLSGRLLSGEKATIRFRAWEATRDIQLRVCCDRIDRDEKCAFETELGVKRGSRKWRDHLATCPQGTKKIIFECRNVGQYQGACGVDNIQLVNEYCPSVTPMKANRQ